MITVSKFNVSNVILKEMIDISRPIQHKKIPIRYLDDNGIEQPFVLVLPKMKGCVYEKHGTKTMMFSLNDDNDLLKNVLNQIECVIKEKCSTTSKKRKVSIFDQLSILKDDSDVFFAKITDTYNCKKT